MTPLFYISLGAIISLIIIGITNILAWRSVNKEWKVRNQILNDLERCKTLAELSEINARIATIPDSDTYKTTLTELSYSCERAIKANNDLFAIKSILNALKNN